jgi:hypothetical protein
MNPLFNLDDDEHGRAQLYGEYRAAEERFRLRQVGESLGRGFSFADNTQLPIHRWYMFKEGFSAQLIGAFLNERGISAQSALVVDPFSGSGTTALVAQLRGIAARGVEVNPFFVNVASTKLRWHEADIADLEASAAWVLGARGDCPREQWPELTSFQRLYSDEVLAELFRLKDLIYEATKPDSFTRSLLLLGLTSILELTSRAYKTGKGLKFRKRQSISSAADVRDKVRDKWRMMLDDVTQMHQQLGDESLRPGDARVVQGDARSLPLDDDCADLVIYSPPYANTFDYNEVYKLEMWFLDHVTSYEEWRRVKEASLRSHVSLRIASQNQGDELLESALNLVQAPARGETQMLRAYFSDMALALAEQRRIARKGAWIVIVVGNSSYRCVPIATDLILARLAEAQGLRVNEIRVGRRLNTSSQQMARYNEHDRQGLSFVRESAVILQR